MIRLLFLVWLGLATYGVASDNRHGIVRQPTQPIVEIWV